MSVAALSYSSKLALRVAPSIRGSSWPRRLTSRSEKCWPPCTGRAANGSDPFSVGILLSTHRCRVRPTHGCLVRDGLASRNKQKPPEVGFLKTSADREIRSYRVNCSYQARTPPSPSRSGPTLARVSEPCRWALRGSGRVYAASRTGDPPFAFGRTAACRLRSRSRVAAAAYSLARAACSCQVCCEPLGAVSVTMRPPRR